MAGGADLVAQAAEGLVQDRADRAVVVGNEDRGLSLSLAPRLSSTSATRLWAA